MAKFIRTLLIIAIFLGTWSASNGRAQKQIVFEHLGIPDGLSNQQIWSITQDRYGFMWFGTNDGLNRYDGYEIKVYKNKPGNANSLPDNRVVSLLEDSRGTLWVGTWGGLARFNRDRDDFTIFRVDSSSVSLNRNAIFTLYQDSKGNMWVGTISFGILQFDPISGKFLNQKVQTPDGTQHSFLGTAVPLLETVSGNLYSQSRWAGLLKFDPAEGVFKPVIFSNSNEASLKQTLAVDLLEDKSGKIWISGDPGLWQFEPETGLLRKIHLPPATQKGWSGGIKNLTEMFEDSDGNLWIGTIDRGLYRYNMRTNQYQHIARVPGDPYSLSGNTVFTFYRDRFGILWIGTFGDGLNKFDSEKEPFRLYSNFFQNQEAAVPNSVTAIEPSATDGEMWLGTSNGLLLYNLKKKTSKFFRHQPGTENSLVNNRVNALKRDPDGNLWIGTLGGLDEYAPGSRLFSHFKSDPKNRASLTHNNIQALEFDHYGTLWVGTSFGLNKFDPHSDRIARIPSLDSRNYDPELLAALDSLYRSQTSLSSILQVGDSQDLTETFQMPRSGYVLISSVGEGLSGWEMVDYGWVENAQGDTIWNMFAFDRSYYLNGAVKNRIRIGILKLDAGEYSLHYAADESHSYSRWNDRAPSDSLWWGIQVFPLTEQKATALSKTLNSDDNTPLLISANIRALEYSRRGVMWIGTGNGLTALEIVSKQTKHYQSTPDVPGSLSNNDIQDLYEDPNGILWIATLGGLNRFDPETEQFRAYHERDGLPSDYVYSIEEDNYGNLWIGTVNGLSKVNRKMLEEVSLSFVNYDVKDGLQGYEFIPRSSVRTASGELFFGGHNGFNAFFPGKVNTQPPTVLITDFFISNRRISPSSENSPLTRSILETREITLPHNQNDLSFNFAALHYSRPEKNKTVYKLDGLDEDWRSDNRKFASYTNLDPGMYTFRVKGANSDGIWSPEESSIQITILTPWWKTTAAYAGYVFLLLLGIFLVDRLQRRRLVAREKEKAKIQEAELRAVAAEAQARAVQAENERKSRELEEARNLQLSMLPRELPKLPHLDIAVYMKTATEVGGDYYDFHVGMDGTLTVVIGDATGHGLNAGTVVTATKSLFSTHAANPDILFTFSEISRCIRELHLKKLSMCLSILKIQDSRMTISSAGMPPALIFREQENQVEEVLLKGMPLGFATRYPYELWETKLKRGDTILLTSDGLPELLNKNEEFFGYERVKEAFGEAADRSAEKIIDTLKDIASGWVKGDDPNDDVTFVVMKVR